MSHHGKSPFHDMPPPDDGVFEKLRELTKEEFFGATGEHPKGKLTPDDEGEIRFAVGAENGKVILNFGTPIAWVGMEPEQAIALASSLIDWARKASDRVLTLELGKP